jgi:phosphatidylserine decarboxylase precursor-related protein
VALAVTLPPAIKWQLRLRGVLITIALAAVAAGLVVELIRSATSLSLLERTLLVAALSVMGAAVLLAYRFYRDPERVVPDREGAVVSPADGEVVYVQEARAGILPVASKHGRDYRLDELTRTRLEFEDAIVVGIGMSFSDVHVNRAPIAGTITLQHHFPGRFGSLGKPRMVFENERATTVIDGGGIEVAVVQIASRLVRKIVAFAKSGQRVGLGQRIGVIRFGSQVDLVLPRRPDLHVLVAPGDRLRAGESVVAIHGTAVAAADGQRRLPRRGSAPAAVVLGGHYRALGVARSLGRRGIAVWLVHGPTDRMASSSRYCARSVSWPDVREQVRVDFLVELAERHELEGAVLFSTDDDASALIARHADQLSAYALTTPAFDVVQRAYDKRLAYALAEEVGVAYPRTHYPRSREHLESLELDFPVILKPTVKDTVNRFTRDKAWLAADRGELYKRYDAAAALVPAETIMVQELLGGGGDAQFSFGALCSEGTPIASVVARRLRQYPIDFGHSSSCVETVEESDVAREASRLLEALRFSGLVEVEFKRDPRDRRLRLLDINPRLWTWHSLAMRAGVDLPYLQWQLAVGEPIERQRARPGVRWVRPATDALAVAALLARRQERLWRMLRTYRGPIELAPFARDDPLPAVAELPVACISRLAQLRAPQNGQTEPPLGSELTALRPRAGGGE